MKKGKTVLLNVFLLSLLGISSEIAAQEQVGESASKVVAASEVQWTPLNPARGDKSPQAATLWGDRNGPQATGFLVKFIDGFSSPPHIHNVTYRGVVVGGEVHNDDPDAKPMWMPAGSFWTQPAGEPHITAAKGTTIAYIEIDSGPYLVRPVEKAFDKGERPVNVDASNLVWLDASNTTWIEQAVETGSTEKPQIAFLWGSPRGNTTNGTLLKLPAGFVGAILNQGADFRAIVIKGQAKLKMHGEATIKTMTPGSYFSSLVDESHRVSCEENEFCTLYVRSNGKFKIITE